MISRRQFLGAVTMMTESARSLRPSRVPGRSSLESHRAEAGPQRSNVDRGFNRTTLENAPAYAVDVTGARRGDVEIARNWSGSVCRTGVVHRGTTPARLKEIVLFDLDTGLPGDTELYGEGFQMLSQTGGTLGSPLDFSQYTDAKHYRMPVADGSRACYGLLTVRPPDEDVRVIAFTS